MHVQFCGMLIIEKSVYINSIISALICKPLLVNKIKANKIRATRKQENSQKLGN